MRGDRLCACFASLGFTNVQAIISSGNVIFETKAQNEKTLETKIEKALTEKLGFTRAVIIRNHADLQELVAVDHFNGVEDTPASRLNVSFLKKGGEIFSVIDTTDKSNHTPDYMRRLEKEHGKEITMRTWKTVMKILKKLES